MSAGDLNWEQLPEAVVEAFIERLHLVEILLDPLLPEADKRAEQRHYQQQHGVGERTIRGYLLRYRKRGPRGLLLYRPRPTSPRVHDAALRAKLLELIDEVPTRSVPQLRKLIKTDAKLGARIARISDRTLYRFLADHGLTKRARYLMLADDGRTSFRSFEAPHTLALVQADARDGIWLDTPDGRKKTYLFLWIDDFSRKILFGKYYFDEKLPALLDSLRYCLLRYGIPTRVYVDGFFPPAVRQAPHARRHLPFPRPPGGHLAPRLRRRRGGPAAALRLHRLWQVGRSRRLRRCPRQQPLHPALHPRLRSLRRCSRQGRPRRSQDRSPLLLRPRHPTVLQDHSRTEPQTRRCHR